MEVGKIAMFSIKTNSVPQIFSASREIEELINMPVEGYNFEKELNVSIMTRIIWWTCCHG